MKAVIMAGGFGTRICEISATRPKPMIEIGGRPLLWHLMKTYEAHGIREFIVCCGYKAHIIHDYFARYHMHEAEVTYDLQQHRHTVHRYHREPWKVTCVDTGLHTMTGGRLARVADYIGGEVFCMTYGDGLANVDITSAIEFHHRHGKTATVCAIRRSSQFGTMQIDDEEDTVQSYVEKPLDGQPWINGGFFVLNTSVFDLIDGDQTVWEHEPIEQLTATGQLMAWRHNGFWKPMDTLKDHQEFESLHTKGVCPWLAPIGLGVRPAYMPSQMELPQLHNGSILNHH